MYNRAQIEYLDATTKCRSEGRSETSIVLTGGTSIDGNRGQHGLDAAVIVDGDSVADIRVFQRRERIKRVMKVGKIVKSAL